MAIRHFLTDAVILSTVLSGLKRAGNFEYDTDLINNTAIRIITNSFLKLGDFVLDWSVDLCQKHPEYFRPLPRPKVFVITRQGENHGIGDFKERGLILEQVE